MLRKSFLYFEILLSIIMGGCAPGQPIPPIAGPDFYNWVIIVLIGIIIYLIYKRRNEKNSFSTTKDDNTLKEIIQRVDKLEKEINNLKNNIKEVKK